jgi:hypothetical protein
MNRSIDWRIFCCVTAVAALLALGIHALVRLNFWVCFALVVAGIALNGIIATVEDEEPGGFHNPKPEDRAKEPK